MKIVLSPSRVLVEKTQQKETKTKSGIILQRATETSILKGKVVEVGMGTTQNPMNIKVGDIISYKKGMEITVELEDKKYDLIENPHYLFLERDE